MLRHLLPPGLWRLSMACAARGGGEPVVNQWASLRPALLLGWDVTARLCVQRAQDVVAPFDAGSHCQRHTPISSSP